MTNVRIYCRAYLLSELRRFPEWPAIADADYDDLDDDLVVYVWDDFTVVTDPVDPDTEVLVAEPVAAWEQYCREELGFRVPDGLAETPATA